MYTWLHECAIVNFCDVEMQCQITLKLPLDRHSRCQFWKPGGNGWETVYNRHHRSLTAQVSQYQNGTTNLHVTEARDSSEWQWHQLGHMQVCTSLQTDNHASTPPLTSLTKCNYKNRCHKTVNTANSEQTKQQLLCPKASTDNLSPKYQTHVQTLSQT